MMMMMTMMVIMTMMVMMKEIDCGVCGLARVWVGGATMGAALQFCVSIPQICFRLKVGREKIKELAIIQTGGNAVVLTEEIM